ncbi:PilZ domain-containing protein [Methylocaldum sp.]|uniref:PilZ domain-containing protein n=1 Tax=Methylocaldum sp. TaxID=1969727 RepID=UPI0039C97E98
MNLKNASPGDRRTAPRSISSVRAYLISPAGGSLRGITKNLSRSGIFLQTAIHPDASVGEPATVVFAVESGKIVRLLRYSVVVKRESRQGYGLEFGRALWSTAVFRRK